MQLPYCLPMTKKMFLKMCTISDCLKLQIDVNKLHEWCLTNKLSLNIKKCSVLTFTRSTSPIIFDYKMNNCTVERVRSVNDLGVTYDDTFSFKMHVQRIVAASYKNLGFIMRESYCFNNIRTIKLLNGTLVRPKLEYASVVWYPHALGLVKQIEAVQNKFLRYLHLKQYKNYPDYRLVKSLDLRNEFQIQRLSFRRSKYYVGSVCIQNLE